MSTAVVLIVAWVVCLVDMDHVGDIAIEPVIVMIVAWVVCLVDMDHVGDCVGMCRAGACSLHS